MHGSHTFLLYFRVRIPFRVTLISFPPHIQTTTQLLMSGHVKWTNIICRAILSIAFCASVFCNTNERQQHINIQKLGALCVHTRNALLSILWPLYAFLAIYCFGGKQSDHLHHIDIVFTKKEKVHF